MDKIIDAKFPSAYNKAMVLKQDLSLKRERIELCL